MGWRVPPMYHHWYMYVTAKQFGHSFSFNAPTVWYALPTELTIPPRSWFQVIPVHHRKPIGQDWLRVHTDGVQCNHDRSDICRKSAVWCVFTLKAIWSRKIPDCPPKSIHNYTNMVLSWLEQIYAHLFQVFLLKYAYYLSQISLTERFNTI